MSNHYLAALDALAYSRPHLDPANYAGAYAAYRADQRGNVQAALAAGAMTYDPAVRDRLIAERGETFAISTIHDFYRRHGIPP